MEEEKRKKKRHETARKRQSHVPSLVRREKEMALMDRKEDRRRKASDVPVLDAAGFWQASKLSLQITPTIIHRRVWNLVKGTKQRVWGSNARSVTMDRRHSPNDFRIGHAMSHAGWGSATSAAVNSEEAFECPVHKCLASSDRSSQASSTSFDLHRALEFQTKPRKRGGAVGEREHPGNKRIRAGCVCSLVLVAFRQSWQIRARINNACLTQRAFTQEAQAGVQITVNRTGEPGGGVENRQELKNPDGQAGCIENICFNIRMLNVFVSQEPAKKLYSGTHAFAGVLG
ncbi:uncharacterized protein LOC124400089 isoform X2 [Silurus meridionalis]|uniref:uncharacterized protein LOC124400089 isoform X2 n=1 Tax=Silurus meridionalis TaxID=175797 RepID=UPI001EEB6B68|nr:uncharacterized protein LOC124400089 isoform X2 [Silurus meridionalis]